MNLHLAEISSQVAPGAHAVITLDGAGWHRPGGALVVPENISLLPLPPYSPELNPVENIWQYLRQNYLANRIFETYDAILGACCDAWNALVGMPDTIRSIATREWLLIERETASRETKRFESLMRTAKLRHREAVPEDIDYKARRGLDNALFQQMLTGRWIKEKRNLMITGPCGVGKT